MQQAAYYAAYYAAYHVAYHIPHTCNVSCSMTCSIPCSVQHTMHHIVHHTMRHTMQQTMQHAVQHTMQHTTCHPSYYATYHAAHHAACSIQRIRSTISLSGWGRDGGVRNSSGDFSWVGTRNSSAGNMACGMPCHTPWKYISQLGQSGIIQAYHGMLQTAM